MGGKVRLLVDDGYGRGRTVALNLIAGACVQEGVKQFPHKIEDKPHTIDQVLTSNENFCRDNFYGGTDTQTDPFQTQVRP